MPRGVITGDKAMTNSEIRKIVTAREGVRKVRISRDGRVTATGEMPRGDGGRETWTRFEGWREDFRA
jgi:hypothetical protein